MNRNRHAGTHSRGESPQNEPERKPARQYRQGDVLLVAVDRVGSAADAVDRVDGRLVLARGEATGHAHAIRSPQAQLLRAPGPRLYLVVSGKRPAVLRHEEHAPVRVPPGVYEIRQQNERRLRSGIPVWLPVRD